MASTVRAVVLNAQADYAKRLRGHLLAMANVKIAAEVFEPGEFMTAAERFRADVLIIDLDPSPEQTLQQVSPIIENNRNCTVFAISRSEDPRLILSCMRAGVREFLGKPVDHEQLLEAFGKVSAQKTEVQKFGKVISVVGSTGGVGASTLAANLACEFTEITGEKVVLVDLDYDFGVVTFMLDMAPQFTIEDLCGTTERLEPQVVERALAKHPTGVSVLPRPHQVGPDTPITPDGVGSVLSTLQETFEFVVVDGPMRYDPALRQVLDNADMALMVMNLTLTSVRNADRIMQGLSREGYNLDRMGLVLNRAGRESGGMLVEHVEQALNREISWTIPDDAKLAASSMNIGEPLINHAPQSKLRQSIRELAQMIHNPDREGQSDEQKKRVGFMSRMFSI